MTTLDQCKPQVELEKISVILPCYNHSLYLKERIDSILSQTCRVSQIIFLDDHSSDCSFDLAKSLLSDVDIEVIFERNSANSGSPFLQWNRGVKLAKYPLVWIAETDDTCSPTLVARLSEILLRTGSAFAFSQSHFVSSSGMILGSAVAYQNRFWPGHFDNEFVISGDKFNQNYLQAACAVPNASAALIDRSAYISAGLANESMRFSGDWDLWIRLAEIGNVAFISDELNFFRTHAQTTRSKGVTPRAAAERLACKLYAVCSVNRIEPPSINALWVIQRFLVDRQSLLSMPLKNVHSKYILQVVTCYQNLSGFVPIARSGWLAIWLSYFFSKAFSRLRELNFVS